MDKQEAKKIIAQELKTFRDKPYHELIQMIDAEPIVYEVSGSQGATYQTEIQAFWDDKPNKDIRIIGAIDDCGWRVYSPLCDGFIKNPEGEFIGE